MKLVPRHASKLLGTLLHAAFLALPTLFRVKQLEIPDHWHDEQGFGFHYLRDSVPLRGIAKFGGNSANSLHIS